MWKARSVACDCCAAVAPHWSKESHIKCYYNGKERGRYLDPRTNLIEGLDCS